MKQMLFITVISLLIGCMTSKRKIDSIQFDSKVDIAEISRRMDTFIYYDPGFLMYNSYNFPRHRAFVIYRENGKYYIEAFFKYYKRKKYRNAEQLKSDIGKQKPKCFYEGPFLIDADTVFRFFTQNRIDTVISEPNSNLSSDHSSIELIYMMQGADSTFSALTYQDYENDSLHIKSQLLVLTSNVIKDADIRFKKKKVKRGYQTIVYDL